uniref:AP complex mu/sigma subunit domain-containing protein n=2 Tax=Oryza brachyantha TaxID=4533 RepID=J3LLL7_ORYBR
MIQAVMVMNTQGKPRLLKFYSFQPPEKHQDLVRGVFQPCYYLRLLLNLYAIVNAWKILVEERKKNVDDFFTFPCCKNLRVGAKLVYKHLATLYFVFVFDSSENELAVLDLVQVFVETLDRCFKNVCELDIVFNFNKLHTILDEMILGGQVIETSSEQIMRSVEEIARVRGLEPLLHSAPMSDLRRGLDMRRELPSAEVVGRLKDDGDFDGLRRAIIRKVKDNEVLRRNIIAEVKQSVVINEDGSEKLKLKDLSDAIYQDIGSKIMGQISDEIWAVIQSNETDIRGTVEAVYNRMMNPEQQQGSPKKPKRNPKEEQVSPAKASTSVAVHLEDDDPEEPPGFGFSDHQRSNIMATQQQQQPPNMENHNQVKPNEGEPNAVSCPGDDEEDPDVPPGFG